MLLFIAGLIVGSLIGVFAMAMAAMAALMSRDEEIAYLRRQL